LDSCVYRQSKIDMPTVGPYSMSLYAGEVKGRN